MQLRTVAVKTPRCRELMKGNYSHSRLEECVFWKIQPRIMRGKNYFSNKCRELNDLVSRFYYFKSVDLHQQVTKLNLFILEISWQFFFFFNLEKPRWGHFCPVCLIVELWPLTLEAMRHVEVFLFLFCFVLWNIGWVVELLDSGFLHMWIIGSYCASLASKKLCNNFNILSNFLIFINQAVRKSKMLVQIAMRVFFCLFVFFSKS